MRWEGLFADLEAQWEAEQRRDLDSEVADRTRRERAEVDLLSRLAAAIGAPLRLRLLTGRTLEGDLADLGKDWLLLRGQGALGEALVPTHAVVGVDGLGGRSAQARSARRFAFGYAARSLSRDRAVVAVTEASNLTTTGTIDGVGADVLDLTEHALGEVPRRENIRGRRAIPFAAIVVIESR